MSDRNLLNGRPAAGAAAVPETNATADRPSLAASLAVAAVSFLVILAMIVGVWVMTSRRPTAAATDLHAAGTGAAVDAGSDVVMLLDNNYFVTPLPPTGDRSVTCQYTIAVRVSRGGRARLDHLVAPGGRNMLCAIREQVRRIIAAEDYLKLRGEQLDEVKHRIRHYLNGLLGVEAVEDVIFDRWNVIS